MLQFQRINLECRRRSWKKVRFQIKPREHKLQSEDGHDMFARVAARARELRWQWNGNRAIFASISPDLTFEKRLLTVCLGMQFMNTPLSAKMERFEK